MNIIDVGAGSPVVLIPGVQGRWEWMRPTVNALARTCRVITFSLADEPTAGARFDEARGFDNYVEQVRDALDARAVEKATICGVSYGGLIATAFAVRFPQRTAALVLVSALPPGWQPDRRVRFYVRAPRLLAPLFVLGSLRLFPEIAAANGGVMAGLMPALRHGWNVITHLFSPALMARRVRLAADANSRSHVDALPCPTLIVTGEAQLDRVVPVHMTRQYTNLARNVRTAVIPRTGHLGLITRPDVFADVVGGFVRGARGEGPDLDRGPGSYEEARRHIG